MKLKILLFTTVLVSTFQVALQAQTDKTLDADTQQKIEKVENNLRPLVSKEGDARWNLEARMRKYQIAGLSLAVIHNYKIDWAKGYGTTGQAGAGDVTAQTVFQAASMSKFVNAVALLKLRESKAIDLDEDINTYLTSWKFPYNKKISTDPITLRQLLSHTAGLSTHGFGGYKSAKKLPNIVQTLEGNQPANSDKVKQIMPPNEAFKYSGGGTTISQLILTNQANTSYEAFLNENIFTPLGMNNSFYSVEFDKYLDDLAYGHLANGQPLKNHYNIYPESAAAGLWTTPSDLAKLIIDVQLSLKNDAGKILSNPSSKILVTPPLKSSNTALGLFTSKKMGSAYLQHSGANKGFRGKLYFSAENGNGLVVMVNGTNTEIIREIIRSVASVYKWADFKTLIASPD
ncbi:MAG: serine hydrolase domain-containing protein [Thermonemataceae bacterium]